MVLVFSYIVYGFYHGVLMAGFEAYQKKSNFYKKNKTKKWYKLLSWFVTMKFGYGWFSLSFQVNPIKSY